jgi:uncharacterized membrane protein
MPIWALTVTFWVHMAATVTWVGALFLQAILILPGLQNSIPKGNQALLLEATLRRFQPLIWLSLALLLATGLTQMSANPNYGGFLSIDNPWSVAIFAKHLTAVIVFVIALYQSMALLPRLQRIIILSKKNHSMPEEQAEIIHQQNKLARFNFLLAFLILALTAIARTA